MRIITILAAGIIAAFTLAAPAHADSKKGATRTCAKGDTLVKLADGRPRCFEKGKTLPDGATVVERVPTKVATAPAAAPAVAAPASASTLERFAQAAEACLAEEGALSEKPGQPGGFAGADGRLHFTSPNDELAEKCVAAGNAANRPQRWK